jgi:hypothetical protein
VLYQGGHWRAVVLYVYYQWRAVILEGGDSGLPLCYTKVVCSVLLYCTRSVSGVLQCLKQWRPATMNVKVMQCMDDLLAVLALKNF